MNEVDFSYDAIPILKDVHLEIYEGEFIGMIGPNGGGKTTLLKLILGFLQPTKGIIQVFGEPAGMYTKHPGRIAYVPQSIRLDRDFPISVEEVVLSGLLSHLPWYGRFRAVERKKAMEALEKTGVAAFAKVPFGTLSGGQAQRVLIARAIVSEPKLLLLDEPTASVDSKAEEDVYTILKELKDDITILMVTHDLHTAIAQVERVLCVQQNVISLQPKDVCEHFAFGLYHIPIKREHSD